MAHIILASKSQQRRQLLKAVLKTTRHSFSVRVSHAPEVHRIETNCAALVKHNATLKAREVAGRLKSGLVIGADTVVSDGQRRLIGKPRSHREAKKILRQLSRRPHWVFTGVAVVDARTGKERVDVEKTKVFMHALSEAEMDAYHRHTTPLDKAGGFDIEGRGGLFIHRIEGCYSNVIGLPMAKLRLMLKEFGVSVL